MEDEHEIASLLIRWGHASAVVVGGPCLSVLATLGHDCNVIALETKKWGMA